MIIILQFLNDFPFASSAPECRDALDFVLALHENSFGLVASAEVSRPTRHIAQGGSEAWKFFFNLRRQAWQTAGLDPSNIWPRHEAVLLCIRAMKDVVTNERHNEIFETDDPDRNLIPQQHEQTAEERNTLQSQIDSMLYGGGEWPFGGVLW
jgi:hypothetical protein